MTRSTVVLVGLSKAEHSVMQPAMGMVEHPAFVKRARVGRSISELARLRKLYGNARRTKRKVLATVRLANGTGICCITRCESSILSSRT